MKRFLPIVSSLALAAALALPLSASAFGLYGSVGVSAGIGSTSAGINAQGTLSASFVERAIQRADQEIARRIDNLTALSNRIGQMIKLSASDKASIQASLAAQISSLNTLKATIDADATTSLKADIRSITQNYRIYMLIIPQGRVMAAADRVLTIVQQFQTLGPKLQARITALAATGADVTALNTTMVDFNAKVADASTQASAAISEVATLKPDNGDATVEASNKAALQDARSKVVVAIHDLNDARVDAGTVIKGVKGKGSANATASTTP